MTMIYTKDSWDLTLSPEALSLDGEMIEDHVEGYHTISVSGRESLEYDITDDDRPVGTDGMLYYGKRQQSREITVQYALSAPDAAVFMRRYRRLKNFCIGEGRLLRFADEPNAHYTGTLSHIDAPDAGSVKVIAEMTFYCADPYLVSDITETVTAERTDGILTAVIDNDGSGEVYPVYRIRHTAENGYLGIVHAGGAFEMGNIDEADTVPYEESQCLIQDFPEFSTYTGTHPQNADLLCNGRLTRSDDGRVMSCYNPGTGSGWHGGCMRMELPPDIEGEVGAVNCYCWFELNFMTSLMGQTGLVQVLLTDENDVFMAGFGIRKDDQSGNTAYAVAWTGKNTDDNAGEFKSFKFTPSMYNENPFNGRGAEDILKQGSKLRFYFHGAYYEVDNPKIADKKVKYVYIYQALYGNDVGDKTVPTNLVKKFFLRKDRVNRIKDIKNRYAADSEVVIDTGADTIMLNGLPVNDELVTGSTFAPLPPGETTVTFYPSGWCRQDPDITVEYRKRWL